MSHESKDYIQALRAKGYRVTPQRLIILDAVCALEGHATIGDIQAKVHYFDPSIDRSTIYRALEVLSAVGLVTEADLGHQKIYRIAGEAEHHHLSCKSCGKVLNIPGESIAAFIRQIQAEYGFRIVADHMVFSGFCDDCSNKSKTTQKP